MHGENMQTPQAHTSSEVGIEPQILQLWSKYANHQVTMPPAILHVDQNGWEQNAMSEGKLLILVVMAGIILNMQT